MKKDPEDPIDQIRRTRYEISAKFDHDPQKLVEHYMQLQSRHAERLISSPAPTAEGMKKTA